MFNNGVCHATLLYGRYAFRVRENQYDLFCRGVLRLRQKSTPYHSQSLRSYLDILGGVLFIRLRTGTGTTSARLETEGHRYEMILSASNGKCRYFHLVLAQGMLGSYSFALLKKGKYVRYGHFPEPRIEPIRPAWVPSSVFYQIFPDRFNRAASSTDGGRKLSEWFDRPATHSFFGGNLKGIEDKLAYLQSLGATAVYSTPVFAAATNHRYDTSDYAHVDPLLGKDEDIHALVRGLHRFNMRFIGDAVFNHTGTGFAEFTRFLKGDSNWYIAHSGPELFSGRYSMNRYASAKPSYETWEGVGTLPKLNLALPEVRNHLIGVLSYWTGTAGFDGWRFDVGESLPLEFISAMRDRLRRLRNDAYMLGEVWRDPSLWLLPGLYDGTMNYVFRKGIIDFAAGKISGRQLSIRLGNFCNRQPASGLLCQYNLLGSHDTPRIASLLVNRGRIEMAHALLFALPGAPSIYYGDEFMLRGVDSIEARGTIDWSRKPELASLFASLSTLRAERPALTLGDAFFSGGSSHFAVRRLVPGGEVSFICSTEPYAHTLDAGESVILSGRATVRHGKVCLGRYGWAFLSRDIISRGIPGQDV